MKNKKIISIFLVILVVFTSLSAFSSSVSAYTVPSDFTVTVTNPSGLPFSTVNMLYQSASADEIPLGTAIDVIPSLNCIIYTDNGNRYIQLTDVSLPYNGEARDGVYGFVSYLYCDEFYTFAPISADVLNGYSPIDAESRVDIFIVSGVNSCEFRLFDSDISKMGTYVLYDMGIYLDDLPNGGGPVTCPTLQEQINSFNGTWDEFQSFFENNTILNSGYSNTLTNEYNQGFDYGEQVGLRDGYNVGYEEGTIYGDEIGYNRGYQSGYNKGVSDEFVGGFFTNMLNAPINILNGIVIYQISDGGTPLDKTDDVNITVWGVLVVAVIISLFLILLKIFAGG